MQDQSVERRLAAILAADVVGYSRLMEADEAGTLARLKTIRLELIDPAIAKCKGRIVKTTQAMECWLNTARLYADAIQSFSKLTAPDHTHHAFLAASLAQLGNSTAAAAQAREVLQREPAFTAEGFLGNLHYQQHSDAEHLRDGLVKAGLPN